jgi:hypothetical protein
MKFWSRFFIWSLVAFPVPIGILIMERGYNVDAMRWIVFVAVLWIGYEVILFLRKKK